MYISIGLDCLLDSKHVVAKTNFFLSIKKCKTVILNSL